MSDYCLGEALIVANLVEEIVSIDNDDFPTLKFPILYQKLSLEHDVFVKRTNKI